MKVIDRGHIFELEWLDGIDDGTSNKLIFVKREGDKYPGNVGHHSGTNLQEVLRACISRVKYVDNQMPSPHNDRVLKYLRCAIAELEERAAKRHGRSFEPEDYDVRNIESYDTCNLCGHIGCEGECR